MATVLLATAPLAARLGWWWWSQGRQRPLSTYVSSQPVPTEVEHTEIEMVKKTLGRWRVRVVSTHWTVPGVPSPSARTGSRHRAGWLGPMVRFTGLALEANSRNAPPVLPLLPAPPARPEP